MAKSESAASARRKAAAAEGYSKSCSNARPIRKSAWAWGAPELANSTWPYSGAAIAGRAIMNATVTSTTFTECMIILAEEYRRAASESLRLFFDRCDEFTVAVPRERATHLAVGVFDGK